MANLSKIKRDNMIAFLEELKAQHNDDASIRAFNEIENHLRDKKYGLVWEEHSEEVDEMLKENIPVLCADPERRLCKDENLPWNFIIEGDNLQALYLLQKTHRGKVDCIYIDPPYNKGNKDWKYNNDYVDENDAYRHSKWLSMMRNRLWLAKDLLNPSDSVLICTIDEKEYHHLGCLLEEIFPESEGDEKRDYYGRTKIHMISSVINVKGSHHADDFARSGEYIFFVMQGKSIPLDLPLSKEWLGNVKNSTREKLRLGDMMRHGKNGSRKRSPNCFYPIYVSTDGKKFLGVGEPLFPLSLHPKDVKDIPGVVQIWPFHSDGSEGCWGYSTESIVELQKKGYLHLGNFTKRGMGISYIQPGWQKRIESGEVDIIGYGEDGFVKIDDSRYKPSFVPGDIWQIPSHNATEYGMKILQKFVGDRFSYPKSLYAVFDTIQFFVANKKDATIIDFFAGSGTTQHAVNLLNAKDGGSRKCIMITNNEIGEDDEQRFAEENYGNDNLVKWDKTPNEKNAHYEINYNSTEFADFKDHYGIAKYITWPRTFCSINGIDVNNNPISGDYGFKVDEFVEIKDEKHKGYYKKSQTDAYPELSKIKMSDGFKANVKYFKCEWTPRKPEDYLLSNALCLHIREMIELQNAIEVDNVKNVLILNKSDFNETVMNPDVAPKIENIWVNQNIIFNAEEMKTLEAKGFKFIPKEFFGQELREAAE